MSSFALYDVIIAFRNSWKNLDGIDTLITDVGERRNGVYINRISVSKVYDISGNPFLLIDESRLEETLKILRENDLEVEPRRIGITSLKAISHFLGHEA